MGTNFWSDKAQFLLNGLRFKDGVSIDSLSADPTLVATDAATSSFGTFGGILYIKQDNGLTTNWVKSSDTVPTQLTGVYLDLDNVAYGSLPSGDYYIQDTGVNLSNTPWTPVPAAVYTIGFTIGSGAGLFYEEITVTSNGDWVNLNRRWLRSAPNFASALTIGWDEVLSGDFTANDVVYYGTTGAESKATLQFDPATDELTVNGIEVAKRLKNIIGTGVLEWAGMTPVNAGVSADVNVTAGNGIITDDTDPDAPVSTEVTWAADPTFTAVLTGNATYFYVDIAGTIQQQATEFTPQDSRDKILLGIVNTVGNTAVNTAAGIVVPQIDTPNLIRDLSKAVGIINIQGNLISSNGGNLSIDKDAGKTHDLGSNYVGNKKDPSSLTNGALGAPTFAEFYSDGAGGASASAPNSVIDPTMWDDDSGTLQTVPNNDWTVKRVYLGPVNNGIFMTYGRAAYTTLNAAKQGFLTETPIVVDTPDSLLLLAYLFVKEDATALNGGDALFIQANKFGHGVGGGAVGIENTIQEVYLNSITGETLLDDIIGKIIYRNTLAGLPDNVLEVVSNDSLTKYLEVSDVRTSISDADGTFVVREDPRFKLIEDFKVTDAATYFPTLVSAAVIEDEVTPISGHRSIVITPDVGLSGSATTLVMDIDKDAFRASHVGFRFTCNATILLQGDMSYELEIFNGAWRSLGLKPLQVGLNDYLQRFIVEAADTQLRIKFNCNVVAAAESLKVDDFMLDLLPDMTQEAVETQSSEYYGQVKSASVSGRTLFVDSDIYAGGLRKSSGNGLYTVSNTSTNGLRITMLADALISVREFTAFSAAAGDGAGTGMGATYLGVTSIEADGSVAFNSIDNRYKYVSNFHESSNASQSVGGTFDVKAGEELKVHTDTVQNTVGGKITISAKATSKNVVFEGVSSENNAEVRVLANGTIDDYTGFGSISFTSWATGASYSNLGYRFDISGLSVSDTSKLKLQVTQNGTALGRDVNYNIVGDDLYVSIGDGSVYVQQDFTMTITKGSTDYKDPSNIYSVPVTNQVENTFSARVDNSGVASVATSSSPFIASVNRTVAGNTTITLLDGLCTENAAVSVTDINAGGIDSRVLTISPTTITVESRNSSSGTPVDSDYTITLMRQGADYNAPKGYFLGEMPSKARLSDGSQQWFGEYQDGQKVYEWTFKTTVNLTNGGVVTNTIPSGIVPTNAVPYSAGSPNLWIIGDNLSGGTDFIWLRYDAAAGSITVVQAGAYTLVAGATVILKGTL